MTRPVLLSAVLAALLSAQTSTASPNDLKVTLKDGRITVVADGVPVRRILEDWAKLGQIEVTNLDQLTGPPVTLQLIDVPEKHALDVLLRAVAGFLAAPRNVDVPGASQFDRIFILATSRPPAAAPVGSAQTGQSLVPRGEMTPDDEMQAAEVPMPPGFVAPGPGFQGPIYPQPSPWPSPGTGQAPPPAQTYPVLTSPRPGMIQPPTESPAQVPPTGVWPNPGIPPVTQPSAVPSQTQPPKKPGGGP